MIAAAALAAFACAQAPIDFDAFFEEFRAKRGTVESVQAAFDQINIYPNDSEMTTGSIVFADGRLVLRYDDPLVVYHVDGEAVFEYDADIRQVLVIPISYAPDAEAFVLAFANEPDRLRELYEVGLVEPLPGDDPGPTLVLRPRDTGEGLEPPFVQAQLRLRDEDYLPTHIFIERDADTQVNILITEYVVNAELAETALQVLVPAGTDIIQDDVLVERVGPGGRVLPDPALIAAVTAPREEADWEADLDLPEPPDGNALTPGTP